MGKKLDRAWEKQKVRETTCCAWIRVENLALKSGPHVSCQLGNYQFWISWGHFSLLRCFSRHFQNAYATENSQILWLRHWAFFFCYLCPFQKNPGISSFCGFRREDAKAQFTGEILTNFVAYSRTSLRTSLRQKKRPNILMRLVCTNLINFQLRLLNFLLFLPFVRRSLVTWKFNVLSTGAKMIKRQNRTEHF